MKTMKRNLPGMLLSALLVSAAMTGAVSAYTVESAEAASEPTDTAVHAVLNEESNYGTLLFDVNFNTEASITNGCTLAAPINSEYSSSSLMLRNGGVDTVFSLTADPAGESAGKVLSLGGGVQYPQFILYNFNFFRPGTYTLQYDYYVPSSLHLDFLQAGMGTTERTNIVYGKWTTVTVTRKLEPDQSFNTVPVQACKLPSNTTAYYVDNVKLYYKAPSDEIKCYVMYGDELDDILQTYDVRADDVITLPTAEEFAEYIPEGCILSDFFTGDGVVLPGGKYTVTDADIENGAVYITPDIIEIPEPQYGTPVFYQNFASFLGKVPVSGQSIGKVPAEYGTGNYIVYDCNVGAAFGVEELEDLDYLTAFAVGGSMMYPQMRITNMYISKLGLYTLACDYYIPSTSTLTGLNIYAGTQTGVQSFTKGKLTHNVMSYAVSEGGQLNTLGFEGINPSQGDGTFYLANMVLYYKALPHADVYVYADAEGKTKVSDGGIDYGSGLTLPTAADFASYIPDGFRLTGFTVNGANAAPGSTYKPSDADFGKGTLTVLPVYSAAVVTGFGTQLFKEDFEGTAVDQLIFNNGASGTHTAVYSNAWIALLNTASYPMDAKTFCVSRGANLMSSYIANVNGTKAVAVDQTGVLPNFGIYGGAGNTQQSLALSEAGYYTVTCDFYVPAAYVSSVKTLYPRVYFEDGSFINGRLLSTGVEADTWMNAKITFEQKAGASPVRYILFIAETKTADDGITFYTDNIAMYYADTLAPKSLPVFSVRTESPNGLRFLSFAGTLARSEAKEYGYVVTVDDGNAHDYDAELVLASSFEDGKMSVNEHGMRVIGASNYVRNTKDLVYATDDAFLPDTAKCGSDGVYFSAVVIGIPEGGYHTTVYARPYLKVGEKVVYGAVEGTSLYDAAKNYKESDVYVENDFVESVLAD